MNTNHRRQARTGPSIKKHGLSAFLFVCLIGLSSFTWLQYYNGKAPEQKTPKVERAMPPSAPTTSPNPELPDLMAMDNIPMDENPTEILTLEGGPNGGTASPTGPKIIDISSALPRSSPLVRAPVQGLSRMSPFGKVPSPATDGRTAMNVYARPFSTRPGMRYISIVIGGLGLDPILTQRAIDELPGAVTLSFAAQTPGLQSWINKARAKGHEVMIELPMEGAATGEANSIYTLKAGGNNSNNIKSLDYLLSRGEGYFAVTNYGGEVLVSQEAALIPVLAHIRNAGLGFIYDGSLPNSLVGSVSSSQRVETIIAETFIDGDSHDRDHVTKIITRLSSVNRADGGIPVGMGFSYAGTIDGVIDWIATKPETIDIAPVSYALKITQ